VAKIRIQQTSCNRIDAAVVVKPGIFLEKSVLNKNFDERTKHILVANLRVFFNDVHPYFGAI